MQNRFFKKGEDVGNIPRYCLQILIVFYSWVVIQIFICHDSMFLYCMIRYLCLGFFLYEE